MSASRIRAALPFTLTCLMALLAFYPVLSAHFLLWDDNINVTDNPWYHPVTLENTGHFWVATYNKTYRPIIHTAWAAIAWVSSFGGTHHIPGQGSTPFDGRVFHAVNLALHLFNIFLVWRLVRLWTQSGWAAAGGTAVFAVHPLQVESVAWVTGFNEVLCGTFCQLATISYLQWRKKDNGRTYVLASVWFGLALLTKPAAVVLPLVLAVVDWLTIKKPAKGLIRGLIPWIVAGAGFSILTQWAHPEAYAGTPPVWWQRPLIAGDALAFYAAKLVLPYPLGIDYGRKPGLAMQTSTIWIAWMVPVLLVCVGWVLRRRSPWPLAVVLAVMAWLLPVLGFTPFHFQLTYSTVADRYLYFALAVVAVGLARGLEHAKWPLKMIYWGVVLAWTGTAYVQSTTWRNNFTCFTHTIQVNPSSWMAEANLAQAYNLEGNKAEARKHYEAALLIRPDFWQMHVMLARYAAEEGRTAEAREHWRKVLELDPGKSGLKGGVESEKEARDALGRT